jgi:hypothetical protein
MREWKSYPPPNQALEPTPNTSARASPRLLGAAHRRRWAAHSDPEVVHEMAKNDVVLIDAIVDERLREVYPFNQHDEVFEFLAF